MEVAGRVRAFIDEQILDGDTSRAVTNDTDLYSGVLDSIGLLQLVTFIEEEFGVSVADADLTPQNFRNVSSIETMILRRMDAA